MTRLLPAGLALALAVSLADTVAAEEHPVITLVKSKTKDPAKPFALVVTFKAKAGKGKELEQTFRPCLAATRKEPGNIAYELNRDPDDPNTYFMYEKFKGIPALEDHLKQQHTQTLLKALVPITEGEPKIKVYVTP